MDIFGPLEKLINEHASASVQKERLELAKEQYEALKRKLADAEARAQTLQQDNEALRNDNARLAAENQRLNAERAKSAAPAAPQSLGEERQKILIAVAQQEDPVRAREVASRLGLHLLVVEQALTDLARDKFVHAHVGVGWIKFSLAESGRRYLIANNLVGAVGNPVSPRSRSMFGRQPI
jgi:hypothetical protein